MYVKGHLSFLKELLDTILCELLPRWQLLRDRTLILVKVKFYFLFFIMLIILSIVPL